MQYKCMQAAGFETADCTYVLPRAETPGGGPETTGCVVLVPHMLSEASAWVQD